MAFVNLYFPGHARKLTFDEEFAVHMQRSDADAASADAAVLKFVQPAELATGSPPVPDFTRPRFDFDAACATKIKGVQHTKFAQSQGGHPQYWNRIVETFARTTHAPLMVCSPHYDIVKNQTAIDDILVPIMPKRREWRHVYDAAQRLGKDGVNFNINFCNGCRVTYTNGNAIQSDAKAMAKIEKAATTYDRIVGFSINIDTKFTWTATHHAVTTFVQKYAVSQAPSDIPSVCTYLDIDPALYPVVTVADDLKPTLTLYTAPPPDATDASEAHLSKHTEMCILACTRLLDLLMLHRGFEMTITTHDDSQSRSFIVGDVFYIFNFVSSQGLFNYPTDEEYASPDLFNTIIPASESVNYPFTDLLGQTISDACGSDIYDDSTKPWDEVKTYTTAEMDAYNQQRAAKRIALVKASLAQYAYFKAESERAEEFAYANGATHPTLFEAFYCDHLTRSTWVEDVDTPAITITHIRNSNPFSPDILHASAVLVELSFGKEHAPVPTVHKPVSFIVAVRQRILKTTTGRFTMAGGNHACTLTVACTDTKTLRGTFYDPNGTNDSRYTPTTRRALQKAMLKVYPTIEMDPVIGLKGALSVSHVPAAIGIQQLFPGQGDAVAFTDIGGSEGLCAMISLVRAYAASVLGDIIGYTELSLFHTLALADAAAHGTLLVGALPLYEGIMHPGCLKTDDELLSFFLQVGPINRRFVRYDKIDGGNITLQKFTSDNIELIENRPIIYAKAYKHFCAVFTFFDNLEAGSPTALRYEADGL